VIERPHRRGHAALAEALQYVVGMFWFRSFAVGLLGACCLLLATRPQTQLVLANSPPVLMVPTPAEQACDEPPPAVGVTVIDVAPGVTGSLLAQLIALAANERITAIDDVSVAEGRTALAALGPLHRQYVDVAITSDAGASRRVLVIAR